MLTAQTLLERAPQSRDGGVVLSYDARLLRRKRLVSAEGISFLVDLPSVTNLDDFWGFQLSDGRSIEVVAAVEELVEVRGESLLRYAWHIGNRHTPCQIAADRLLIRVDHVLEAMLRGLGAELSRVHEPFRPEGGAYGHGRTMGHSHGEADLSSSHSHSHGHSDSHRHSHDTAAEVALATSLGKSSAQDDEPAQNSTPGYEPAQNHAAQAHKAEPVLQPARAPKVHRHGAGCGCGGHASAAAQTLPPYQSWQPDAEPAASQGFGWHHHGDGKMHYHAPRQPVPDDPLGQAVGQGLTLGAKGK